jgi:antitoxin component YwqK of YwqJK toxin-antitoxin module
MKLLCLFFCLVFSQLILFGQYKDYQINPKGDTINKVLKNDKREGKWVIEVKELRGEPGYVEEGVYRKGEKDGFWRRYSDQGDLLGVEHYILGGKDGLQQYFNNLGDLEHEENWKGYNPDAPFDTIPVFGTGSGEIIEYKIVKAEPYSVKDGEWKFYDPGTGRLLRTEQWSKNNLLNPGSSKTAGVPKYVKPEKAVKTDDMLQWEKSTKGKKTTLRDGRTSAD